MNKVSLLVLISVFALVGCEKKSGTVLMTNTNTTVASNINPTNSEVILSSTSLTGASVDSPLEIKRKNADIASVNFSNDANIFVVKALVSHPISTNLYTIKCYDISSKENPVELPSESVTTNNNTNLTVSSFINLNFIKTPKFLASLRCDVLENENKILPIKDDVRNFVVKKDLVIDGLTKFSSFNFNTKENSNFMEVNALIFKREGIMVTEGEQVQIKAEYFYAEKDSRIQTFITDSTNLIKRYQHVSKLMNEFPLKVKELKDVELHDGRNGGRVIIKSNNVFGDIQVNMLGENADAPLFLQVPVEKKVIVTTLSPWSQDYSMPIPVISSKLLRRGSDGKNGGNSGQFSLITTQPNANDLLNISFTAKAGKGTIKALPQAQSGAYTVIFKRIKGSNKTIPYDRLYEKSISGTIGGFYGCKGIRAFGEDINTCGRLEYAYTFEEIPYVFTEEQLSVEDGIDGITESSFLIINNIAQKI